MVGVELVVADVDRTLSGDQRAIDKFAAWWAQHRGKMRLVYTSGRFSAAVEASVRSMMLPLPDAIIGGLGTEICRFSSGPLGPPWHDRWRSSWDVVQVQRTLAKFRALRPRTRRWQSEFKRSYYMGMASQKSLCGVREALTATGIEADLVRSPQGVLDLVPRGANAGAAAMFLASEWCIPPYAVAVASAATTDISLYVHGCRGILVANAHKELKALVGHTACISPFSHAAGVLDGLHYWLGEDRTKGSGLLEGSPGSGYRLVSRSP